MQHLGTNEKCLFGMEKQKSVFSSVGSVIASHWHRWSKPLNYLFKSKNYTHSSVMCYCNTQCLQNVKGPWCLDIFFAKPCTAVETR